ncbi:MAG TPA: hypothetical protein VKA64_02795 [Gammaproteobacteria bacterium]|nr:hypothetical protein [Gammaproteobacteria bacterium]
MQLKSLMPLTLIAGILLASGCVTSSKQTMKEDFGDAVRNNTAAQVIDPMAGQEEMPAHTLDGQKGELALDRYRTEEAEAETDRLVEDVAQ